MTVKVATLRAPRCAVRALFARAAPAAYPFRLVLPVDGWAVDVNICAFPVLGLDEANCVRPR